MSGHFIQGNSAWLSLSEEGCALNSEGLWLGLCLAQGGAGYTPVDQRVLSSYLILQCALAKIQTPTLMHTKLSQCFCLLISLWTPVLFT